MECLKKFLTMDVVRGNAETMLIRTQMYIVYVLPKRSFMGMWLKTNSLNTSVGLRKVNSGKSEEKSELEKPGQSRGVKRNHGREKVGEELNKNILMTARGRQTRGKHEMGKEKAGEE